MGSALGTLAGQRAWPGQQFRPGAGSEVGSGPSGRAPGSCSAPHSICGRGPCGPFPSGAVFHSCSEGWEGGGR